MKYYYLSIFISLLFITSEIFGLNIDSIANVEAIKKKSINVNPSFVLGNEMGISARIEYEKSNFGKLFVTGAAGLLFNSNSYLMLDVGLGYGYPIELTKSYSLYLNNQISFIQLSQPVGLYGSDIGPTGLIEIEYRKRWNNFSISFAPYIRGLYLFHNSVFSNSNNIKSTLDFGFRIGFAYDFSLLRN